MNWLTYHKQLLQLAETGETLTSSQVSAREAILTAVNMREKRINLSGTVGVGKTFLMHSLYHCADIVYFSDQTCYDARVSPRFGCSN